jgi:hypothetical protein
MNPEPSFFGRRRIANSCPKPVRSSGKLSQVLDDGKMKYPEATILIVEDNSDDALLIQRALRRAKLITTRKSLGAGNGGWQSIKLKLFSTRPGEALNFGQIVNNEESQSAR